ncbi:MAG: DUF2184 domain-containing protein [Planctomycetes bacterium]|nr:DUF2184 domain-containing protein [Planctomycetota bacterium]
MNQPVRTRFDDHADALRSMNFWIPPQAGVGQATATGLPPVANLQDAASGQVFFARQLEYIEAQTYDIEYQDLLWRGLFPVDTSVPEGVKTTTYQMMDKAGKSKWLNTGAKDIPRVDVGGKEVTDPVHWGGNMYGYNIGEIASARYAGVNLDASKADASRRAHEEMMSDAVWLGNAPLGFKGIYTTGNGIPRTTVPAGTGGVTWDLKTPDEILADVNLGFSTVVETTKQKERPTHMLLPTKQYNDVATRRVTDTAETVLSYLVRTSPWIQGADKIQSVPECEAAGTAGVDTAFIYTKNPRKIQTIIPKDITFLPVQQDGLEYVVYCVIVFGGLRIRYPLSAHILEGI